MGEGNNATTLVAYIDGEPAEVPQEIPEITTLEPPEAVTIDTEKLAAAVSTVRAAIEGLAPIWEALAKTVRQIAAAILLGYEMERAIRWAEVRNPKLVHFYRHTKKRRIRKKYAKRILALYREEVMGL